MEPVTTLIVSTLSAAIAEAAVITFSVIREKKKRSPERNLASILPEHAKEFEGLYESLYISCAGREFDPDSYNEWCERAALCQDRDFSRAFSASFPKVDDEKQCRKYSCALLSCIKYAGIKRLGNAGDEITVTGSNKDQFECINSDNAVGRTCSIIKPAWVYDGKVIEPGIIKA